MINRFGRFGETLLNLGYFFRAIFSAALLLGTPDFATFTRMSNINIGQGNIGVGKRFIALLQRGLCLSLILSTGFDLDLFFKSFIHLFFKKLPGPRPPWPGRFRGPCEWPFSYFGKKHLSSFCTSERWKVESALLGNSNTHLCILLQNNGHLQLLSMISFRSIDILRNFRDPPARRSPQAFCW